MSKTLVILALLLAVAGASHAQVSSDGGKGDEGAQQASSPALEKETTTPAATCVGKYPISVFSKACTARTLDKGQVQVSLKTALYDADAKKNAAGQYAAFSGESRKITESMTVRYGWTSDHMFEFNIPYIMSNFRSGSTDIKSNGIGNIVVGEKWRFVHETGSVPAVSAKVWYYFPSGDTDRKLGSDDFSWQVSCQASKAFPDFNVHVDAGQIFSEGRACDSFIGNAAFILTSFGKLQPAVEYNYIYTESKGRSHDIIPGIMWKFAPQGTVKMSAVINADTTMTYKDRVGFIACVSYKF